MEGNKKKAMRWEQLRTLKRIIKYTKTDKFIIALLVYIAGAALAIWIVEPGIETYGDSLWYCYATCTTIGFGDVVVTTTVARILSVGLSILAMVTLALITGVVVNYYMEIMRIRNQKNFSGYLEQLDHIDDLSREELLELLKRLKEKTAAVQEKKSDQDRRNDGK